MDDRGAASRNHEEVAGASDPREFPSTYEQRAHLEPEASARV